MIIPDLQMFIVSLAADWPHEVVKILFQGAACQAQIRGLPLGWMGGPGQGAPQHSRE